MKIVVGLPGTADARYVRRLCEAGAGGFFLGYSPSDWTREFGQEFSPNRRYRRSSQVSTGRILEELCAAAHGCGRPISIAFNEHLVTPRAWEKGRRLIREARSAGISGVIVADPSVIGIVSEEFPDLAIHVSGDAGLYNAAAGDLFFSLGASRLIFPREIGWKNLLATMSSLKKARGSREFEVFVMGEPCVYDGARCFTEHGYSLDRDFCVGHSAKILCRSRGRPQYMTPREDEFWRQYRNRRPWLFGKCGLCAIPLLAGAGVTHLKVPGRASDALASVRLIRRMLDVSGADRAFARTLMGMPKLCESRLLCYYPEACGA